VLGERPLILIADAAYDTDRVLAALRSVFSSVDGRRLIVLDRAPTFGEVGPVGARFLRLEALRALTREAGAALFVKERADLALAVGADGLHLGERAIASRDARTFGLPLSRACHDREGLLAAEADLLLLSPVAAPSSKPLVGEALGVEGFGRLVSGLPRPTPVFALGGVTPALAGPLRAAGAGGLAVLGGVFGADSPGDAASELLAAWDAG
jgi:thiamine-phosphate pyrophosphorylase